MSLRLLQARSLILPVCHGGIWLETLSARLALPEILPKSAAQVRPSGRVRSVSERRSRWQKYRLKLRAQLQQAQKMESIGTLAGGVAHDFNNMLGVILGHAEMIMEQMDSSQPFFNNLQEIQAAGQRSADLTRQLLAFARKQTISPKVLDLNKTVESMLMMLRRLIGEDIDLAWLPGKIDLLMTDVVMPEMNSRDLAKKLLSLYPNLKRLFMSGYTANVIAHHGVLDKGGHFIQKPFSKKDLANIVKKVLEE